LTTNKQVPGIVSNKPKKMSGHEQVVEFLKNLEHPQKSEIEEVRQIILSVNENITEHVKWNAPSFCYKDEDRVTFNLHGKGFFRLILHTGAKVNEEAKKRPLFEDTTGLVEQVKEDRVIVRITNMSDDSKKDELAKLVARWIEVTSL
jgi:hypothetical protein